MFLRRGVDRGKQVERVGEIGRKTLTYALGLASHARFGRAGVPSYGRHSEAIRLAR
jgi:hypothetical protein